MNKNQITNKFDIPLLLAAWLMADDYDYIHDPKYISATGLMKPLRELILSPRVDTSQLEPEDLSDRISRVLGNSVHSAVENVWLNDKTRDGVLKSLGINPEQVEVNPEKPNPEKTQVYIEQRAFKKLLGFTVGGKFDAVIEGIVHDIKTTSAWAWVKGTRDEDFKLQGSIYRWLNPDKITEDYLRVCFVFTDWQSGLAANTPGYPDQRVKYKDIPLYSIEETENWVRNKIQQLIKYMGSDDVDIPLCTDEDVWMTEPSYRYFTDPTKIDGRATRVFAKPEDAQKHLTEKGKGIIISTAPVAKKCSNYCSAFLVCKQKDNYTFE